MKKNSIINKPNKYNGQKESKAIKIDLGCGKNPRIDAITEGNGNCIKYDGNGNKVQMPHQWSVKGQQTICNNCNAVGEKFISVDIIPFDGVDVVLDIANKKWPWKDSSVDIVHASHFVEHLEPHERIHFVNELFRVLKNPVYVESQVVKGIATIIVPHWCSQRAYGDMTHKWPPVSEFWFYYLDKDWRAVNAPHNQDYKCHFQVNWGYNTHPALNGRNQEYINEAMMWNKEACSDIIAHFTKKQP